MSAVALRAMVKAHPDRPSHGNAISHCIDACFACVQTCMACADACLSENRVDKLITCIRLNLDCAAVCSATGTVMTRTNKVGHRQLLEAQLTTCIAFCRTCATECERHAGIHKHCEVCARICTECAEACNDMLQSMRLPA